MKGSKGINAIECILEQLEEDEHITGDFKRFITACMWDYLHSKKLDYAITSSLNFNQDWFEKKTIEEIKQIIEEKYPKSEEVAS